MNKYIIVVLGVLAQIISNAWSENVIEADGITGKIQLGGALNQGNTKNRNVSADFVLDQTMVDWSNKLKLAYYFNRDDHETTASRFKISVVSKYILTSSNYLFASGEAVIDRFGSYDRVYREAGGYGHNLYKNSSGNLSVYAGPGVTHSRISGVSGYIHQFIVKVGGNFCYKFMDNVVYTQDIISYIGHRNTNTQWKHGLETQISKRLALDISVCLDYNSNIPETSKNRKHLDTVTKLSVIYKFG